MTDSEPNREDPLVTHSLREAKWILLVWVAAFVWVIGYTSRFGYIREGETISTVWGLPAWVFWGVALPWGIATVVSSWFALRYIADEPLIEPSDAQWSEDE